MNAVDLNYGSLSFHIKSEMPITIPLPLEQHVFPTWTLPMQVEITLYPLRPHYAKLGSKDIPAALQEFYSAMETLHISCIPPQRHCNSWWTETSTIWGYFPYETDNFFLRIMPDNLQVEIFGNENNLNRVILDILSCFAILPPLHGAAVTKNGRTAVLLGESGGGKTRILNSLIKKGYTYIADEEIFWIDNKIFCCGRVIVEKSGRPNICPYNCLDANTAQPVTDVFLLTDSGNNVKLPVLLPVIARQSFWAQSLVKQQHPPMMIDRLKNAYTQYMQLFSLAKVIEVDQTIIENSLCEIERSIWG